MVFTVLSSRLRFSFLFEILLILAQVKAMRNFDINEMMGFWYVVQYYASSEEAAEYSCMKCNFTMSDESALVGFAIFFSLSLVFLSVFFVSFYFVYEWWRKWEGNKNDNELNWATSLYLVFFSILDVHAHPFHLRAIKTEQTRMFSAGVFLKLKCFVPLFLSYDSPVHFFLHSCRSTWGLLIYIRMIQIWTRLWGIFRGLYQIRMFPHIGFMPNIFVSRQTRRM